MTNFLLNLINGGGARFSLATFRPQLFIAGSNFFEIMGAKIHNMLAIFMNWLVKVIWTLEKFVLGIMELLEFMVDSFLGIGTTVNDYLYSSGQQRDFVKTLITTFRAIVAVAIVLMIIFTILAIIRQEFRNATSDKGFSSDGNEKGPIIMKLVRGIIFIIVLPIAMVIIIGGVNSTLTAFSRALQGETPSTVAASVLSSSSYNSNKFRVYANEGKRVPIVIEAYNVDDYDVSETKKLFSKISSSNVQNKLSATCAKLKNPSEFLDFNESLNYSNNQFTNSSKYADYYESFICTPQQYQVMAEFIDYVELTESQFYIRAVDDEYVSWKYVSSAVFNDSDKSLTIDYIDGSGTSDLVDGKTYSITYMTNTNVSSPISDTLNTIQALLGIGDYSDNLYYEMERQEGSVNVVSWEKEKVSIHFSENFKMENPQTWLATDELIMYEYNHFSSNNTFGSHSLSDFSYAKTVTGVNGQDPEPIELNACKYVYREYYAAVDAYSEEKTIYCVLINGNYYEVEKSQEETDLNGNYYYLLKDVNGDVKVYKDSDNAYHYFNVDKNGNRTGNNIDDSYVHFLEVKYTTIYENTIPEGGSDTYKGLIKLSDNFNLYDSTPNRVSWSYSDQIIMYEYYKDRSWTNDWSSIDISSFKNGYDVPTYTISTHSSLSDVSGTPGVYIKINGVYYQASENTRIVNGITQKYYELNSPNGKKFISEASSDSFSSNFYYISSIIGVDDYYGLTTNVTKNKGTVDDPRDITDEGKSPSSFIIAGDDNIKLSSSSNDIGLIDYVDGSGAHTLFEPENVIYQNFDIKLSSGFDYNDVTTWTYRDYFIVYLYSNILSKSGATSIELLKNSHSIYGDVGKVKIDGEYVYLFRIDSNLTSYTKLNGESSSVRYYLKIEDVNNISQFNILKSVNDNKIADLEKTMEGTLFLITPDEDEENFVFDSGKFERKEFKFSSDFVYNNLTTWKVQDYLLILLNEKNSLNISQSLGINRTNLPYANLSSYYYNSLVYIKEDGDIIHRYYKFKDAMAENEFYLIEDKIIEAGYEGIDDWLSTPLSTYLSKRLGNGKLFTSLSDISSEIYNNYNFKNTTYSVNDLIKKIVDDNKEKFSFVSKLEKYSYYNNTFNENDKKTWTYIDYAIDRCIGTVAKTNYNFSVVSYEGKKYCIIGNHAINISDSDRFTLKSNSQILSSNIPRQGNHGNEIYLNSLIIPSQLEAVNYYENELSTSQNLQIVDDDGQYIVYNDLVYEYEDGTYDEASYFEAYESGLDTNGITICEDLSSHSLSVVPKDFMATNNVNKKTNFANGSSNFSLDTSRKYQLYVKRNTTSSKLFIRFGEINYFGSKKLLLLEVSSASNAKVRFTGGKTIESKVALDNGEVDSGAESFIGGRYIDSIDMAKSNLFGREDFDSRSKMNVNDITTWTLFDLFYYAYFGKVADVEGYVTYYSYDGSSGEEYIELSNDSETIYLKHSSTLDIASNFEANTDNSYVGDFVFGSGGDDREQLLSIIYNYLSGGKSTYNIEAYSIPGDSKLIYKMADLSISKFIYDIDKVLGGSDISISIGTRFDSNSFYYTINATNTDVDNWNILDYALSYKVGISSSAGSKVSGKIFEVSTSHGDDAKTSIYFVLNKSSYINLSKLGLVWNNNGTTSESPIIINNESKIITTSNLGKLSNMFFENFTNNVPGARISVESENGETLESFKHMSKNVNSSDTGYSKTFNVKDTSTWTLNDEIIYQSNNRNIMIEFSDLFDPSDPNTWTQSDYIIYYVFNQYLRNQCMNFSEKGIKNLQYYINQGYVPATMIFVTINNTDSYMVLLIGEDIDISNTTPGSEYSSIFENRRDYLYLIYDETEYLSYFSKKFLTYEIVNVQSATNDSISIVNRNVSGNEINRSIEKFISVENINFNSNLPDSNIQFSIQNPIKAFDFEYDEYYYFNTKTSFNEKFNGVSIIKPSNTLTEDNNNRSYFINLRLSENFDLNNPDTWTVLDYIIVTEYSNNVNNNFFAETDLASLKTNNLYYQLVLTNSNVVGVDEQEESGEGSSEGAGEESESGSSENNYAYILKLNGNYYDLSNVSSDFITFNDSNVATIKDVKINGEDSKVVVRYDVVNSENYLFAENGGKSTLASDVSSYSFRVLNRTINFFITDKSTLKIIEDGSMFLNYVGTANVKGSTLSPKIDYSSSTTSNLYTNKAITYVRRIDNETYQNFHISLTLHDNYSITEVVRQVNWPQKLMNDMQVLYPDLNWPTLIATDGWMDTLGEYHSGKTTGQYLEYGNSANTTAVGLVLSEFFLSVAEEQIGTEFPAKYSYSSLFDEEIIKSLMLSIMGEEKYYEVSKEATAFVNLFNIAFASILDDIAYERGVNIMDGKVNNLVMSVYKSYLSTAIMSSDLAQYLWTVATRVYSQYTIYEYLAKAGGDYASYYAYINGGVDDNGETVDSFTYSSFAKLVEYENNSFNFNGLYNSDGYTGSEDSVEIPMFTFNIYNVVKWYNKEIAGSTDKKIKFTDFINSEGKIDLSAHEAEYKLILSALDKSYKEKYGKGNTNIPYSEKYESDNPIYCFMLDVYWSIWQNVTSNGSNLNIEYSLYHDYIMGNMTRGEISLSSDTSMSEGSQYLISYNRYKAKLFLYNILTKIEWVKLYMPTLDQKALEDKIRESEESDENDESGSSSSLESYINSLLSSFVNIKDKLHYTFDGSKYEAYVDYILPDSGDIFEKFFEIRIFNLGSDNVFKSSENGGKISWQSLETNGETQQSAWKVLKNVYEFTGTIINELNDILNYSDLKGYRTDSGAVNSTEVHDYDSIASRLSEFRTKLGTYINAQEILDRVNKTCITFTLAQYGNNYIEEGYKFTIKNHDYQMKTSTSAQMLAEYVYGGEFLTKFGRSPFYTDSDFKGIIRKSTEYDSDTRTTKTKLDIFGNIREFAKRLAEYTSKLYYLTNLNDVSVSTMDSIRLTDSIYVDNPVNSINDATVKKGEITYTIYPAMSYVKSTPEYLILDYIVENEVLPYDTLYSLIVPTNDSEGVVNRALGTSGSRNIDNYLAYEDFSKLNSESAVKKSDVLRAYLWYIQTTTESIITDADHNPHSIASDYGEVRNEARQEGGGYSDYGFYLRNTGYMGSYSTGLYNDDAANRVHKVFKKVMEFITGANRDDSEGLEDSFEGFTIDFDNDITNFKSLKIFLTDALRKYVKYETSTGQENTDRYLGIFNLIAGEFNYYKNTATSFGKATTNSNNLEMVGRTLIDVNRIQTSKFTQQEIDSFGVKSQVKQDIDDRVILYKSFGKTYSLTAKFRIDLQTKGMVLKLAGISNRPLEELVNLEYNDLYDKSGCYDEAYGDTFVVCTYDIESGLYYPVLARSYNYSSDQKFRDFMNEDFSMYFRTEFCCDDYAYPVVAKGPITAGGLPTAIRTENGDVKFYRTDITASSSLSSDSVSEAKVSSEITTIGYVKYVPLSQVNSNPFSSASQNASFIGSSNATHNLQPDASSYYVQRTSTYKMDYNDEFYAISPLDNFSSYYNVNLLENDGKVFHALMFLGFVTVIPILIKALLAAMRRILDLILLILIGPLMIAMNSLEVGDGPHKSFTQWREMLTKSLLMVFGIVVSFSLYHILISTIMKMTFITAGDSTMTIIDNNPFLKWLRSFGFIGGFLSVGGLNAFVKFAFVLVGSMMIESSAKMIGSIITGGRVENPFSSQVSNTEPMADIIKMVKEAKNSVNFVGKLYSGELLEEAMDAALLRAKQAIPGSAIAEQIGNLRRNGLTGKGGTNAKKIKQMSEKAQQHGVDKKKADKLAKDLVNAQEKSRSAKKKKQMENANKLASDMALAGFTAPNDGDTENGPTSRFEDNTKAFRNAADKEFNSNSFMKNKESVEAKYSIHGKSNKEHLKDAKQKNINKKKRQEMRRRGNVAGLEKMNKDAKEAEKKKKQQNKNGTDDTKNDTKK